MLHLELKDPLGLICTAFLTLKRAVQAAAAVIQRNMHLAVSC